jgi:hypothetical protein
LKLNSNYADPLHPSPFQVAAIDVTITPHLISKFHLIPIFLLFLRLLHPYLYHQILLLLYRTLLPTHLLPTHLVWILFMTLQTLPLDPTISNTSLKNFVDEHAEPPKADIYGAQMSSMIVTKIISSFSLLQLIQTACSDPQHKISFLELQSNQISLMILTFASLPHVIKLLNQLKDPSRLLLFFLQRMQPGMPKILIFIIRYGLEPAITLRRQKDGHNLL